MSRQPEALCLSDELEAGNCSLRTVMRPAAAELRRLHAENEQLCARLRQQSEQDPYAWHYTNNGGASAWHMGPSNRLDADMDAAKAYPKAHRVTPLYTQPQPPRQPLNDKQIDAIAESMPGGLDGFLKGWGWRQFARAILSAGIE